MVGEDGSKAAILSHHPNTLRIVIAREEARQPKQSIWTKDITTEAIYFELNRMLSMQKGGYIYILTNKNNTVLYVGVTSNLDQRIRQHRSGYFKNTFTSRYNIRKLVYYEMFLTIEDAIHREKQLKSGSRKKKIELINKRNPKWIDLYGELCS